MKKIPKTITFLGYSTLLIILIFIAFHASLEFGFWKDDWLSIWDGLYSPRFILMGGWYHVGGNLEFYLLTKVLKDTVVLWQSLGLLLRFFASLAVCYFARVLFESKKAGYIAGILFASTVIGMDATSWASAYIGLIDIIFLCIGFHDWIVYLQNRSKRYLFRCGVLLLCVCILDIWRMVFIIPLLHYVAYAMTSGNFRNSLSRKFLPVYFLGLCITLIFFYINISIITSSQIFQFISQHVHDPIFLISKLSWMGNFFNSLFYLFAGWAIKLPESGTLGIHSRIQAILGLGLIFFSIVYIFLARISTKSKYLYGFFLLWIFSFYITNWLFQPRLIFGVSHRYQVISGIGLLLCITYTIKKIRNTYVAYALILLVVMLNIRSAWRIYAEQLKYRSDKVIQDHRRTIDKEIAKDNENIFLLFTGNGEDYYNNFVLASSFPLVLKRRYSGFDQFPIVVYDIKSLAIAVCGGLPSYIFDGIPIPLKRPIHMDHVYAYEVIEGRLIPVHDSIRKALVDTWCPAINNR